MDINKETKLVIDECIKGSHDGTLDFKSVVLRLSEIDLESYHADYRRKEITYYFPNGQTYIAKSSPPPLPISVAFKGKDVEKAVRSSQQGKIDYNAFMKLSMEAGCVGYFVLIKGRKVQYFGRCGEMHIEHFPNSN